MVRNRWSNYINRQGSRFETKDKFKASSTVMDTAAIKAVVAGVPMSQLSPNVFACTKDEIHTFVIGESGCGKTRRVILPTVRLVGKTGESMVIADPKGEIYKYTGEGLKKKGYNVKVINFRTPAKGNRWNPLALIEKMYRSDDPNQREKSLIMLDDIFTILQSEVKNNNDAYWENSANDFMLGVAQIILEYGEEGSLTFENIAKMGSEIYLMREDSKMNVYLSALPADSTVRKNLSAILDNPDKTAACVYTIFQSMISPFTSQESIVKLFSESDFDIAEIGKSSTALYIILPDDSPAFYSVATVLVNQIYRTLIDLADAQPRGLLPNKTMFILDEFANFAPIPGVDAMLTAARSRGMRFVLVCQSMEQLDKKYEHAGAEILLSNCRTWIYMSCRNYNFLRRLEEFGGTYISPYTKERAPLISVSELQHFEMGKVLVLNDRCYPYIGYLPDYSKFNFGEEESVFTALPEEREFAERKVITFKKVIKNKPLSLRRKEAEAAAKQAAAQEVAGDSELRRRILSIINGESNNSAAAETSADPLAGFVFPLESNPPSSASTPSASADNNGSPWDSDPWSEWE